jgi:hypothetical protein
MSEHRRVALVCTGRGAHPQAEVYTYDGPWPPADRKPVLLHRGVLLQLTCPHPRCSRAPRPSRAMLVKLLAVAATQPDGRLDISMLAL